MDSASNFFGELFSKRLFINQLSDLSRIKEGRIEDRLKPKYKITKDEIQAYFEKEIKGYIEKELIKSKNQTNIAGKFQIRNKKVRKRT